MDKRKFWSFVTIFGTLWGGLELTLGTFLHVLHVPKTGLIMVTLSVILLIAQRRIFPARGSTLCTGVIAACLKGLSPGGIIAGPIFGILSEALMVELCLFLSCRHVFAGMCAGGMAVLWSQVQSLFTIWIYYGQDFIDSVIKVVEKFFRMEWTAMVGWTLLASFLGVVLSIGAIAGLTGWRLGGKINLSEALPDAEPKAPQSAEVQSPMFFPSTDDASGARVPTDVIFARKSGKSGGANAQAIASRRFVWPIALLTLCVQFTGDPLWSGIALAIWLTTLFLAARGVLRSIWWPKFWALTLVLSILCGIIIAWGIDGTWHWATGFEATARMMLRGIYVFSLVNWATRSVRSEEFLVIWKKIHLPELGTALVDAYALLPRWLDRMNEMVRTRPKGIRHTVRYAKESILICLQEATRDAHQE